MPLDRPRPPTAPADAGPGYRIAHALGYLLNPFILPPLLFGLVLAHFGAPAAEIYRITGIALVFFVAVPLAHLSWLLRHRRVDSIEVRERGRRTVPFLVGLGSFAVALGLMAWTSVTAVALVVGLMACQLVNMLLLLLINLRWKISIHSAALAGFVSVLLFVSRTPWPGLEAALLRPAPLYGLCLFVPLLMWARVRTGAHTRGQVLAGGAFGLCVPYAELLLLQQLGAFAGL